MPKTRPANAKTAKAAKTGAPKNAPSAKSAKEAPVRLLQVARVEALRLNTDGEGVAKVNGMTVFVPNLLPGEWATIRIIAVEKSFARAVVLSRDVANDGADEPTSVDEESLALRVTPLCPVFELCGGCQLQHLDYQHQLRHKRQVVVDALTRIAHLSDIEVLPAIGMDHPWRYRNQVQVPISFDPAARRYTSGFFAAGSHQRIATDVCFLISEALEATLQSTVALLTQASRTLADGRSSQPSRMAMDDAIGGSGGPSSGANAAGDGQHGGADLGVHHLILRESRTTGKQMVVFAVTENPTSSPRQDGKGHSILAEVFTDIFHGVAGLPNVDTVAYTVQPQASGPVWGSTVEVVHGAGQLKEDVLGLEFLISPRSFFQTNTEQVAALYREALAKAEINSGDKVLDAYCGAGSMSLLFAQQCQSVVGIDSVAPAIHDARRNAEHNGITNAEFRVGLVEKELPRLLGIAEGKGEKDPQDSDGRVQTSEVSEGPYDVVVVDPPRKGCHPDVLRALTAPSGPKRIVYVSCNPATLARDLRVLVDAGYEVGPVQPLDMFPQTSHVECCLSLTRKL